ncbi:hypothetical protein Bealeia1_00280 [Candidatus Bealeia paramacronuclearis]|uniref:F-box domain-containing protein n=1 Tax=Candidatus Bealeia paramacronuclearis TaxID=1921001 RepID=A0ABZ2C0R9_9PROT|nr:hypothetical protein [Candidatus Bealeia paramacronuclearis]
MKKKMIKKMLALLMTSAALIASLKAVDDEYKIKGYPPVKIKNVELPGEIFQRIIFYMDWETLESLALIGKTYNFHSREQQNKIAAQKMIEVWNVNEDPNRWNFNSPDLAAFVWSNEEIKNIKERAYEGVQKENATFLRGMYRILETGFPLHVIGQKTGILPKDNLQREKCQKLLLCSPFWMAKAKNLHELKERSKIKPNHDLSFFLNLWVPDVELKEFIARAQVISQNINILAKTDKFSDISTYNWKLINAILNLDAQTSLARLKVIPEFLEAFGKPEVDCFASQLLEFTSEKLSEGLEIFKKSPVLKFFDKLPVPDENQRQIPYHTSNLKYWLFLAVIPGSADQIQVISSKFQSIYFQVDDNYPFMDSRWFDILKIWLELDSQEISNRMSILAQYRHTILSIIPQNPAAHSLRMNILKELAKCSASKIEGILKLPQAQSFSLEEVQSLIHTWHEWHSQNVELKTQNASEK